MHHAPPQVKHSTFAPEGGSDLNYAATTTKKLNDRSLQDREQTVVLIQSEVFPAL